MRVCLYEDRAEFLEPLSLTRPVFDLLCGMTTLAGKQLRHVAAGPHGVLVRPELAEVYREQHPDMPVNDWNWLRADRILLINGRWLPPQEPLLALGESCVGVVGDEIAYVLVERDRVRELNEETFTNRLAWWRRFLPERAAGGGFISFPWELVDRNAGEIARDFHDLAPIRFLKPASVPITVMGSPELLRAEPTACIEPFVVADTTRGPVIIDHRAVVASFSRLEGPCYIGPGTQVLGAKIRSGTTLGPECRVGGEVEASIVHGYSNKYHDGFLGHSYVGEWVNLGAGTHNSDLRNDYGAVNVVVRRQLIATGQHKVGCFLGDHTKTGLGTLLNTGTSIGAFCNVLPSGRFAPKWMPSFMTWGHGSLAENTSFEKQLATAEQVMRRRQRPLSDAQCQLHRHIFDESASERRWAVRDMEQRRLRRSA